MNDQLLLILFLLLLFLLLWLLLNLLRQNQQSSEDSGDTSEELRKMLEKMRQRDEANSEAAKAEGLQKLVKAAQSGSEEDKQLAREALKRLLKQAGMRKQDWQTLAGSDSNIQQLAEKLDAEDVLNYSDALGLELTEIKAEKTSSRERSLFPTLLNDVENATSIDDVLIGGSPEQLRNREETYDLLSRGELPVITYYNQTVTNAVLHLLIDVSNSMSEQMNNGEVKRIRARAVVHRLLTRAVRGSAKFLLRFFDGDVSKLYKAFSPNEVDALVNLITNNQFVGSGTEILGAIEQAVADINAEMKNDPSFTADIMLVTDGEPNTPFTEKQLSQILGKIRLHVIIIGDKDNEVLKKVATSYSRMN